MAKILGMNGEYANNLGVSGTAPWSRSYTKDGAKLVRICMDNVDVEYRYDWVEIRDANESIIQVLTGTLGNICSSWVAGPTVKVYLFSDSSVTRVGFTSATLEWMKSPEIRARLPGQWYEKDTESHNGTGTLLYTGLHYNWHRYYDTELGRYISADPLGLKAGMNPYLYALADPINVTDPDGRIPLVGALISGFVFDAGMQLITHWYSGKPLCQFRVNWKQAGKMALLGLAIGAAIKGVLAFGRYRAWKSIHQTRSAMANQQLTVAENLWVKVTDKTLYYNGRKVPGYTKFITSGSETSMVHINSSVIHFNTVLRHEAYHFAGGTKYYLKSQQSYLANFAEEVGASAFAHQNVVAGFVEAIAAGHANRYVAAGLFYGGSAGLIGWYSTKK